MRIMFAVAAGFGLAAALAAAPTSAQQITFPAPVFHGGDTDWDVKLDSKSGGPSIGYALSGPPKGAKPAEGSLTFVSASGYGGYTLKGKIGSDQTQSGMIVILLPAERGERCKTKDGKEGGKYGAYAYTVTIAPVTASSGSKVWTGCGLFTQN